MIEVNELTGAKDLGQPTDAARMLCADMVVVNFINSETERTYNVGYFADGGLCIQDVIDNTDYVFDSELDCEDAFKPLYNYMKAAFELLTL